MAQLGERGNTLMGSRYAFLYILTVSFHEKGKKREREPRCEIVTDMWY